MKSKRAVLITGFEPFGGDATNPSQAIAEALDGRRIADMPVVGSVLPVEMARLDGALAAALRELDPAVVILLGLAEGEPVVRLERVALNLADFRIPDNAGDRRADEPLDPRGPAALSSRLPLREIRTALLAAGIPARLSETAGTYLCNAA